MTDLIKRDDALREIVFWRDDWEVVQAHIRALPAFTVKVKTLEWEAGRDGASCLTDERYSISYWEREKLFVDSYTTMRRYPTLEDAKAAAQSDYEARILAALTSTPVIDPAAIHEAALTAKLTKAVEALREILMKPRDADKFYVELWADTIKEVRAVLAELEGE